MFIGCGIDVVEASRFAAWHTFSEKKLKRIFSAEEIVYCCAVPSRSAERFAVRFAAREALFKALSMAGYGQIPFLRLCAHIKIHKKSGGEPILVIDWLGLFGLHDGEIMSSISLSHTYTTATALVILYQNCGCRKNKHY